MRSSLIPAFFVLLASCNNDSDPTLTTSTSLTNPTGVTAASQAESSQTTPTPTSESGTTDDEATGPVSTETSADPTSGPMTSGPMTSEPMTSEPMTTAAECTEQEGKSTNSPCSDPSGCGCESGHCSVVPMIGGWCGECNQDSDCPDGGGCSLPDPFSNFGSECRAGTSRGDGCETDAACHSATYPHCEEVYETAGGTKVRGCSECRDDSDCPDNYSCEPHYSWTRLAGYWTCTANGSVQGGYGCKDATPCVGDYCVAVPVLDSLMVKVCSLCETDADCVAQGKTTCNPGGGYDPQFDKTTGRYCT